MNTQTQPAVECRLDGMVRRPRVQKEYRDENCFNGRYKQHDLEITRVGGEYRNWYIRVRAPNGLYAYDGYWRDSQGKSMDDAITEACKGACLWTPNLAIAGCDKRHAAAKIIGGQLANVAFNWAQKPGYALTSDDVVMLDKLRRQWDEALKA